MEWYTNPAFMASFGAVIGLGFILFVQAYFIFVRMRPRVREMRELLDTQQREYEQADELQREHKEWAKKFCKENEGRLEELKKKRQTSTVRIVRFKR